MSVGRNVIANSASQLYAALVGLALVPAVVRMLGVEAYGLVGFYTMAQGWFMLLDLGLTPTIGREAARFKGGALGAVELRQLLRTMEGLFGLIAVVGACAMAALSPLIASHWLKLNHLSVAEVTVALTLMAGVVALRWLAGLYRGVVAGFERIVWLSSVTAGIATARFVLVLPVMALAGATITVYFAWQLVVAIVELVVLIGISYGCLPPVAPGVALRPAWRPLRGVLRFALSASLTSVIWVVVTQSDKLILSGTIALPDYAVFTLAVQVASAITLLTAPIGQAVLPRLSRLAAAGDERGLVQLYRSLTQIVVVAVTPLVLMLTLFADPMVFAWTADASLASRAAPVLALYAIGNGVLAVSGLPYFLQVARGDLDLHVVGNLLFVMLFFPLMLWAVKAYGTVGAGAAWVIANALPLLLWIPVVHRRFLTGMHWQWLSSDVLLPLLLPLTAAAALSMVQLPHQRWPLVSCLVIAWALLQLLTIAGSGSARHALAALLRSRTELRETP